MVFYQSWVTIVLTFIKFSSKVEKDEKEEKEKEKEKVEKERIREVKLITNEVTKQSRVSFYLEYLIFFFLTKMYTYLFCSQN